MANTRAIWQQDARTAYYHLLAVQQEPLYKKSPTLDKKEKENKKRENFLEKSETGTAAEVKMTRQNE